MSASSKFDHFGALLCKVCDSPMKDARILFCGHSFCLKCVQKLAQKDCALGWIPCPFNCAKKTPAAIPPQDLTQNLTFQAVFLDPPYSTVPITPPQRDNKAIKNREALEKWQKSVEEAVVGLKAELKERTERMKMMELQKEGALEALLDREANKMLEPGTEDPDAFDWEKAMEDLVRLRNAVEETLSDMETFGQRMKQVLEEGFVHKEADELELELRQLRVESPPPIDEQGAKTVWKPMPRKEKWNRGFWGLGGSQRGFSRPSSVQKGEMVGKTIWKEEELRQSPEQWSRGGGASQRGWNNRGRGQPRFYRTRSDGGLGSRWEHQHQLWVRTPATAANVEPAADERRSAEDQEAQQDGRPRRVPGRRSAGPFL